MLSPSDGHDARARGRAIVSAILDPTMEQDVADREVIDLAVEHRAGGIQAVAYLAASCLNAMTTAFPGESLDSPTIVQRRHPDQGTRERNDVILRAALAGKSAEATEASYVAGEQGGVDALRDLGLVAAAALYRLHELTGIPALQWLQDLSLLDEEQHPPSEE